MSAIKSAHLQINKQTYFFFNIFQNLIFSTGIIVSFQLKSDRLFLFSTRQLEIVIGRALLQFFVTACFADAGELTLECITSAISLVIHLIRWWFTGYCILWQIESLWTEWNTRGIQHTHIHTYPSILSHAKTIEQTLFEPSQRFIQKHYIAYSSRIVLNRIAKWEYECSLNIKHIFCLLSLFLFISFPYSSSLTKWNAEFAYIAMAWMLTGTVLWCVKAMMQNELKDVQIFVDSYWWMAHNIDNIVKKHLWKRWKHNSRTQRR